MKKYVRIFKFEVIFDALIICFLQIVPYIQWVY